MAAPDRLLRPSYSLRSDPGTVLVETERLVVRRYLLADAPDLAALANFPEISANLRDGFPYPYTAEAGRGFIESVLKSAAAAEEGDVYPRSCAVCLKPNTPDNPTPDAVQIGGIGVVPQGNVHYRTWEIGYFLTPSTWGKGYATELVTGFTRWCFETWPRLYRIEADVYEPNVSSAKVLEKCGFLREGKRRGGSEKAGVLLDNLMYGLVRADMEGLKEP